MFVLTSADITYGRLFSSRRQPRVLAVTNGDNLNTKLRIPISHVSRKRLRHRQLTQKEPFRRAGCFPNGRALPYLRCTKLDFFSGSARIGRWKV